MFERRLTCEAELELLSPLHLGSGGRVRRPDIRDPEDKRPEAAKGVWVSQVQVAEDERPIIPGSTIKGLLRGLAGDEPLVGLLFGRARTAEDGIGRLSAFAALTRSSPVTKNSLLPHVDEARGLYVHARVRIDAETGVAADGKLFHAEMVPAGHRFTMRLSIDIHGCQGEDLALTLFQLLARLADPEGVACGRGQTQGNGRLRLRSETLKITERRLSAAGDVEETDRSKEAHAIPGKAPASTKTMILTCDGPYLSVDSSRHSLRGKAKDLGINGEIPSQIEPLRTADGKAMLTGSTVMGALRARAGWLASRQELRAGRNPVCQDNPDKPFTHISETTVVERLFGLGGWRGRLRIAELTLLKGGKEERVTSVAIDPFSAAAIDGALFTSVVFTGVSVRLALGLDPRPKLPVGMTDQDKALFDMLVADIHARGLVLGHGGNKGFGWFLPEGGANG